MDLTTLLKPEIVELLEAYEKGRLVLIPERVDEQRFGVENALDIRLYDWQSAYIWGNSRYLMPGRSTGKTLAQIIKLCVSEGCPLVLPTNRKPNLDGIGIPESFSNYRWFRDSVLNVYKKLELYQVPGLRKIYFSDKEAQADGFNPWRF